jgi:ABC-type transporter MlaC component
LSGISTWSEWRAIPWKNTGQNSTRLPRANSAKLPTHFSRTLTWAKFGTTIEQIQIVSQELRGANAEVSGSMRNSSDEVADLKFKLRNIEGQWKINDFSVNAESAMHNYRGDFKQAFEKSGFDGLMAKVKALQAKLDADLAHGSRTAP